MSFTSDEWSYVIEGNANIILEYVGEHSDFKDTIMRVEKKHQGTLSYEKWRYRKQIMRSLFQDHYIPLPVRNRMKMACSTC
jgi:hypothetical protein